jgi:RNA polymerase sigma factor FliA
MTELASASAAPSTPQSFPAAPSVTDHLGLVKKLAYRFARHRRLDLAALETDDLVSLGTEALIDAARRFDPARGASFSTFAYCRVHGAMLDAIRAGGCYHGRQAHEGAETRQVLMVSLQEHEPRCLAIPDEGPSPEDAVHAGVGVRRLRRAIPRLPAQERRLVEGTFFEELTLDELGAELGTSRSWTCRMLHRSLDHLRELLADA